MQVTGGEIFPEVVDINVGMENLTGILQNGNSRSPENATCDGRIKNIGNSTPKTPFIKIVEQPASKALRFRYECEGRSAGSIPGVNNKPENKTYPTIQIVGYKGRAVIVVSCVTKDEPYRAHPHNLVGKENCKKGICTMEITNETMTATFSNLGIQCVKKKDIEDALKVREEIRVDPFRQGFAHSAHPSSIDLNAVRLCFQAFIDGSEPKKYTVLTPVVSDPIYDKKAMSDLVITRLSHTSAPAKGGQEVILLCEKVAKEDIQIQFYEEVNGNVVWEGLADFTPIQVHKQVAIYFKTPPYKNTEIQRKVKAFIQMKRPSDGTTSEPLPFYFTPVESDYSPPRKTPKMWEFPRISEQQPETRNNRHPASFTPMVKAEPCCSPDFPAMYGNSPSFTGSTSSYDVQAASSSPNYIPHSFPNPSAYNRTTNNAELPSFNDFGSHMKLKQPQAPDYNYMRPQINNGNFPTDYNEDLIYNNFVATNADSMMISNQPICENTHTNETETRTDNNVVSLELKVDTKDLISSFDNNCQIDNNCQMLSENLSQSLIISDNPPEQNTNMTDSLTKIANDALDQMCDIPNL